MNKKIIAIVTALSILGTNTMLLGTTANAKENGNNPKQEEKVKKDEIKDTKAMARIAGIVLITAQSGANIRSGAGTNYGKVGTAPYGAEVAYAGKTKADSNVTDWYYVYYNGRYGWIS